MIGGLSEGDDLFLEIDKISKEICQNWCSTPNGKTRVFEDRVVLDLMMLVDPMLKGDVCDWENEQNLIKRKISEFEWNSKEYLNCQGQTAKQSVNELTEVTEIGESSVESFLGKKFDIREKFKGKNESEIFEIGKLSNEEVTRSIVISSKDSSITAKIAKEVGKQIQESLEPKFKAKSKVNETLIEDKAKLDNSNESKSNLVESCQSQILGHPPKINTDREQGASGETKKQQKANGWDTNHSSNLEYSSYDLENLTNEYEDKENIGQNLNLEIKLTGDIGPSCEKVNGKVKVPRIPLEMIKNENSEVKENKAKLKEIGVSGLQGEIGDLKENANTINFSKNTFNFENEQPKKKISKYSKEEPLRVNKMFLFQSLTKEELNASQNKLAFQNQQKRDFSAKNSIISEYSKAPNSVYSANKSAISKENDEDLEKEKEGIKQLVINCMKDNDSISATSTYSRKLCKTPPRSRSKSRKNSTKKINKNSKQNSKQKNGPKIVKDFLENSKSKETESELKRNRQLFARSPNASLSPTPTKRGSQKTHKSFKKFSIENFMEDRNSEVIHINIKGNEKIVLSPDGNYAFFGGDGLNVLELSNNEYKMIKKDKKKGELSFVDF
jgi:hypothetical protein